MHTHQTFSSSSSSTSHLQSENSKTKNNLIQNESKISSINVADEQFIPDYWNNSKNKKNIINNRLQVIEDCFKQLGLLPILTLLVKDYYLTPKEYVVLHQDNPQKILDFCLYLLEKPYATGVACIFGDKPPSDLLKHFPLLLKLYFSPYISREDCSSPMVKDLISEVGEKLAPQKLINAVRVKILLQHHPDEKQQKEALELMKTTPDLNLSGTNLASMDLSGMNLSFSNLGKANLSETNLSHSILKGCFLGEAEMSRVLCWRTDFSYSHFPWFPWDCSVFHSLITGESTPLFIGADLRFIKTDYVHKKEEDYFTYYIKNISQDFLEGPLAPFIPLVEYFKAYKKTHKSYLLFPSKVPEIECCYALWLMGSQNIDELTHRIQQIPTAMLKFTSKNYENSFAYAIEQTKIQFKNQSAITIDSPILRSNQENYEQPFLI